MPDAMVFQWIITALVIPAGAWIARSTLGYLDRERARAHEANAAFIGHLERVVESCRQEREAFLSFQNQALREHTDVSKEMMRELKAMSGNLDRLVRPGGP